MKSIIVYALGLLAMVHGEDGTHRRSQGKAISLHGNPYKYLLPAGSDRQMCMPGSEFEGVCRKCICSEDGTKVICSSGPCSHLPRHRRDAPSGAARRIHRSESCTICSCDHVIDGRRYCAMVYYEKCPLDIDD